MRWTTAWRRLWPTCCAFCGEPQALPVCLPCCDDLPWLEPVFALEPFVAAVAPLAYAFPVDAAIKRRLNKGFLQGHTRTQQYTINIIERLFIKATQVGFN